MNLSLARNCYLRTARSDNRIPDDPHALIGLALAELHRALGALSEACAAQLPVPSGPMTRTLSAIYLLQSSLDFDRGGDIAPALFKVYEYCRQATLDAFHPDPDGETARRLAKAAGFVDQIRAAWSQMEQRRASLADAPPAPVAPQLTGPAAATPAAP
ncbi:flagellar export chaperone FliS [Frigidibacter oleivorans]|uniref:flagellar export chaperone FliS n=1 Tax=Frigidibacter oleivorans TaxID=2487129 RepID=UPI000F8CF2C2|nr:flagellar protein FliS [Frigidibacter oleivorans]